MTVRASVWRRVLALFIDVMLMDLLFFPQFSRFLKIDQSLSWESLASQQASLPHGFVASMVAMGIIALLYFTLYQHYLGQTLGMRLLGLRVAGDRSLWRCALRNAFALPFFPFTLFWIMDPLYLFWRKERLLERWSGTATVEMVRM